MSGPDLAARLQRLEDDAAIRETLYAYGSALDYGDRERFLGCFTTDTTNIAATIDGDTADVTSYFLRVDAGADPVPATILASGRYVDVLVRDGGSWRIRSRRCEVENL